MGLEEQLRGRIEGVLQAWAAEGRLDAAALEGLKFGVEPPKRGVSGALASNVALVLAKPAKLPPRELAARLAAALEASPEVASIEIAGPGFLNFQLSELAYARVLGEIAEAGSDYGRAPAASGQRVNVEFVSANPTGPLLISHGRGAVVGDVVARLLEATGHRVTREYYINDFGNQVRLLGVSVLAAARGEPPPEGGYGGEYVDALATYLKQEQPELLGPRPDAAPGARDELVRACITLMLLGVPGTELAGIRPVLTKLGIDFDVFSSEEALHRWGRVDMALRRLQARGLVKAQADGSVVFITGEEDDKDRVVRKRDGATTYFASDIAYHDDKYERGFEHCIDVWGADHHGYIARLRAAVEAMGRDAARFEVLLYQLVKLVRNGEIVKMGKRRGTLITLQEVAEEIDEATGNPSAGRDALRFFFLMRKSDSPITLDVELAKRQEAENPVFYVQYGHARLCAIGRRAREQFQLTAPRFEARHLARLSHPLERALIAELGRYPRVVSAAAEERDPQKIVAYVQGLAQDFQSYYTQLKLEGDAILPRAKDQTEGWQERWDREKSLARLAWVEALRTVYASALGLLGIEAPERMSRAEADEALQVVTEQ